MYHNLAKSKVDGRFCFDLGLTQSELTKPEQVQSSPKRSLSLAPAESSDSQFCLNLKGNVRVR